MITAPRLRRVLFRTAAAGVCAAAVAATGAAAVRATPAVSAARFGPADWTDVSRGGLNAGVFSLALRAARCAVQSGDAPAPSTLSVIDYSLPSTTPRLWVFDVASHALLYRELVAHGQGSGGIIPTRFSNAADTHASSLGLFVTKDAYTGRNGYSLRLDGLEPGFNDRALARAIVLHGAAYVNAATARALGRLGRSWGCPALRPEIAREIIDRVKGGGLVFAYYPDSDWLRRSTYLGDCAGASPS